MVRNLRKPSTNGCRLLHAPLPASASGCSHFPALISKEDEEGGKKINKKPSCILHHAMETQIPLCPPAAEMQSANSSLWRAASSNLILDTHPRQLTSRLEDPGSSRSRRCPPGTTLQLSAPLDDLLGLQAAGVAYKTGY